jgi:hypothetical protein
LIRLARRCFEAIPDPRRSPSFSLPDVLLAGLALFSLKDPSLLAFQRRILDRNLQTVFGLAAIPSDTQMRAILDEVLPHTLRPLFRAIFRELQRGKVLKEYVFFEGCYLLALDGTEYFNSKTIHCQHCLTRHHKNGEVSYYHQALGACIVHPDFPEVIPLCPEPIQRADGQEKNDCERNAARRWLEHFRREHPHLGVIVVEDALSSNAPHIRDLKKARCHFLLGVKRPDHVHLFEQFDTLVAANQVGIVEEDNAKTGKTTYYHYVEGLSLNEANQEIQVNLLVALEVDQEGKVVQWAWVTDLALTAKNVSLVALGGRTRWRIENETFNTLKNQGYHFEHNYGHGEKNLCVVLMMLMMAAFLIDQVQQMSNDMFQKAWKKKGPKSALWEAVRNLFAVFEVSSMGEIYEGIANGFKRPQLKSLVEQKQGKAEKELDSS